MMRRWKRFVVFFLVLLFTGGMDVYAQDGNPQGSEKAPSGKDARLKAKREWKKKRKQAMEDAKAKKQYNKTHNTKKTRKRMKRAEKKARRNNEHKREFFIVRWIKKHRK